MPIRPVDREIDSYRQHLYKTHLAMAYMIAGEFANKSFIRWACRDDYQSMAEHGLHLACQRYVPNFSISQELSYFRVRPANCNPRFWGYAKLVIRRQLISFWTSESRQRRRLNLQVVELDNYLIARLPATEHQAPDDDRELWLEEFVSRYCSPQEQAVYGQLCLNNSYREIADNLGLKVKQVDNALTRIKKKARNFRGGRQRARV